MLIVITKLKLQQLIELSSLMAKEQQQACMVLSRQRSKKRATKTRATWAEKQQRSNNNKTKAWHVVFVMLMMLGYVDELIVACI